jgi:hypothetical protein
MFILNGKPLSPDRAFTAEVDGQPINFPANWLRLSSPEEREAIGVTEEPDPIQVDQRFYWDTGIPKDHSQLVEQWVGQVKQTAGSLLSQTDWYITRASETGLAAPQSVLTRRTEVRALSNQKEAFLEATATTDELAAYVTGPEFNVWETASPVVDETIVVDGVTSGSFVTADALFGGSDEDTLTF